MIVVVIRVLAVFMHQVLTVNVVGESMSPGFLVLVIFGVGHFCSF
jgi:hypothetical protein